MATVAAVFSCGTAAAGLGSACDRSPASSAHGAGADAGSAGTASADAAPPPAPPSPGGTARPVPGEARPPECNGCYYNLLSHPRTRGCLRVDYPPPLPGQHPQARPTAMPGMEVTLCESSCCLVDLVQACETGWGRLDRISCGPDCCVELGDLLVAGRGVPRDEARAAALYRKACDGLPGSPGTGDARGCVRLGERLEEGRGVAKDRDGAMELYRKACDRRNAEGCAAARRMAGAKGR